MNYNRNYKASVFSMLYEDKENVMDLYNGIYEDKCTDPDEIIINTITDEEGVESGIFARFKNDLSFIFGAFLNLFEHQSTVNGNIPVRMLIYVAKVISMMIPKEQLYRESAVKIPAPRFVVFYNGTKDAPLKTELRLSNQFKVRLDEPDLELKVIIYNINTDKGNEILNKSRTLREYSVFVDRTRSALEGTKDEAGKRHALKQVIDECIADGILVKLLTERREEIIMTSILNYDQAAHEQALYEDGYDVGIQKGREQGREEGREEGRASTLLNNVGNLMKTMKMTVDQALDALQISGKERDDIAKAIKG